MNFTRFKVLHWATLAVLAFMLLPVLAFAGGGGLHFDITTLCAGGTMITMLDLAKLNTDATVLPLIEENVGSYPEMTSIASNQLGAGELTYETLIRTGYPTTSFHDMGQGIVPSISTTRKERFEVFPFGGRVQAPTELADNYKKGGAAGYFAYEASGVMKSAVYNMARQIWYGRTADGKGFPGIRNFCAYGTSVTDPLTGKVYPLAINAGGTTSNMGSSCYFVVSNPEAIELQFGQGSVFELPAPRVGDIVDPNNANALIQCYISVLQGFAGLQTANVHSARRIFNLTDDSGKGMTDTLLAKGMASFPAGIRPTGIYMSAHQRYLLQISRTVVLNGQGTNRPSQPTLAPVPAEYDGVPIYATDAIGDTDVIEVAALAAE